MNFFRHSVSFKPGRDIPSLDGKVILVTGGNIGLGRQCVLEYARHNPAEIWLAARSSTKAKVAVEEIQSQLRAEAHTGGSHSSPTVPAIKLLELDLTSLDSVRQAAATFTTASDRLDILMLNAGIMAAPMARTRDGYEVQMSTNYLGHALLAQLLVPVLERTAALPQTDVRVVSVTSYGHHYAPKPDGVLLADLRRPAGGSTTTTTGEGEEADARLEAVGPFGRYGQSKLAQILWTRAMAERHPTLTLAAVHPGVVRTNLINSATATPRAILLIESAFRPLFASVEQGARNQLWASVAAEGVRSGEYYEPVGVANKAAAMARDQGLEERLWEWTEQQLKGYTI